MSAPDIRRLARMSRIDGGWLQAPKRRLRFPWRSVLGWTAAAVGAVALGYFGGQALTWLLLR